LLVWQTLSGRVFQALGAAILTSHSPNLSLDGSKNKSLPTNVPFAPVQNRKLSSFYDVCIV